MGKKLSHLPNSIIIFQIFVILIFTDLPTFGSTFEHKLTSRHAVLDPGGSFNVSWSVCNTKKVITFEVKARTRGYVGFGISPTGGMAGADIVIGGVAPDGKPYLQDRHGKGDFEPKLDAKQDWTLLESKEEDDVTFLKFSRPLITCDEEQDVAIKDESQKFIFCLGVDDEINYHGSSRGAYAVNILDPAPNIVDLTKFKTIDILTNVTLLAKDTLYWCAVVGGPQFEENTKPHIIAMAPKLDNALALRHTHHLSLSSCTPPPEVGDKDSYFSQIKDGNCFVGDAIVGDGMRKFPAYADCQQIIYTWAIGAGPMYFPENVGFSISDRKDKRREWLLLELHIDNPGAIPETKFETGVQLFYTETPRPIEAGMLGISLLADWTLVIPPKSSNFKIVSHCHPKCSQFIEESGYNLFNVQLHAHNSGKKMRVRHFRGENELAYIVDDENYSNLFQDNRNIKEVKVLANDHLTLECTFDNRWKSPLVVTGGMSTRDEMCDATFYYYPKGRVQSCSSAVLKWPLLNVTGIHEFENEEESDPKILTPETFGGLKFSDYLNTKFNWTFEAREQLENISSRFLQAVGCGVSDPNVNLTEALVNSKFKSIRRVNYPKIKTAYEAPKAICSSSVSVAVATKYVNYSFGLIALLKLLK